VEEPDGVFPSRANPPSADPVLLTNHWLALCLEGDDEAFTRLYGLHARRVKVYFLRSGFGNGEADDLTQETFIRIYRSLHTFDPKRGKFRTWISTIARNVARRRWSRRRETPSLDPELAEVMLQVDETPGSPMEARERIESLRDCIQKLDKELGIIVHLRYVEALTTRAIAEQVGTPEATVRLRLKEAQGLLQRCLQGKGILE
jgi:RNA polymerase sigma-70 factor (ECF subfamily)